MRKRVNVSIEQKVLEWAQNHVKRQEPRSTLSRLAETLIIQYMKRGKK